MKNCILKEDLYVLFEGVVRVDVMIECLMMLWLDDGLNGRWQRSYLYLLRYHIRRHFVYGPCIMSTLSLLPHLSLPQQGCSQVVFSYFLRPWLMIDEPNMEQLNGYLRARAKLRLKNSMQ